MEEGEASGGGRECILVIARNRLLEKGEATGGGRESNTVKALPASGSWRRKKQQVEVESVFLLKH